ncbi:hypothetical protein BCR41DRAFT_201364 [Lobosporangium transversale]|uniref:Uncharacterized protein n=1 Tax=Lobosporangium transversale TaxID=64571 RepID=A0A1Y2GWB7_9FUNG|nr:hypothetical protein BCR41DRAFT_201364 [Lobosporangium transversale]ORZ26559.1 hypothetical protein BCR41DRAFT_201364 [Lobosporangium transversale]|eukprot:XP_021884322.1 hypothetical protein BCR41DRAFT_201364 [Lobosporangium transversale]
MAMAEDDDLIVNAVLLSLFPSIARLKDYLAQSLDDCPTLIQDNDPTEYKDLLHNTLVANNHSSHSHAQILVPGAVANDSLLPPFPRNSPLGTIGNHNEIVDLAIEQTCPKTRSWFNGMTNILAIGYTNSRQTQFQQAKNYFPNTLEAFVRSPQWEVLLSR